MLDLLQLPGNIHVHIKLSREFFLALWDFTLQDGRSSSVPTVPYGMRPNIEPPLLRHPGLFPKPSTQVPVFPVSSVTSAARLTDMYRTNKTHESSTVWAPDMRARTLSRCFPWLRGSLRGVVLTDQGHIGAATFSRLHFDKIAGLFLYR